jgi:hypothetical protein
MRLPRTRPLARAAALSRSSLLSVALGTVAAVMGIALGLVLPRLGGGASAEPPALPVGNGPLVIYSEGGAAFDTLWAASPDDPAGRTLLSAIQHATGFGIEPGLSPDGRYIAYTVVPPVSAGDTGELRLFDIDTGETAVLARGVDARIVPVWSAASDAVAVRRSVWGAAGGRFAIVRVDLAGGETPLVGSDAGLFPIGFSPDGAWFYFAALSTAGTDLGRVGAAGGEATLIAHLSDGVARDWHLSPDGVQLAYLAQPAAEAGAAFVARVLDLATGSVEESATPAGVAQFNPVWTRSGTLTVGTLTPGLGGAALRLGDGGGASALAPPARGFDVPLAWSPDGAHLAVRAFAGASLDDPGPSRVAVVGTDGERRDLSPVSDVIIAGWLLPRE